jgi:hypothetical protein
LGVLRFELKAAKALYYLNHKKDLSMEQSFLVKVDYAG